MEVKIKELINELKAKGKSVYTTSGKDDPDAKVNVWYVISKLEELLIK